MNKLEKLKSNYPRLFPFFLSAVVILLFYHFKYGLTIFNPSYVDWVIEETELANGYFSFGYFRHQDWRLPIGQINDYFYPLGTNLYTSDIPLLAIFFKPFSDFLPAQFQYFGMWYLICHLLQAWFTILLCERLKIKGLTMFLVVIFLLFPPVLMSRFIHVSLFCQWMILAAIWIYFIDPEKTKVKKILFFQLGLFLVAGLEFAYMWAMVFGFTVALLLRLWLVDKKIRFYQLAIIFTSYSILMGIIWLSIGLFSLDGIPSYQMEGWGNLTLNLNSLYNGMGTSHLLKAFPYFSPQRLEGYNYLGAGILVLIIACILYMVVHFFNKNYLRNQKPFIIENINTLPLLLFLIFSTFYSLSNTITFNQIILFEYKLSPVFAGFLNSFRASGRFFWPVYYYIFIILFYFFNKINLNTHLKNIFLAGCLVLQIYDIQSYFTPVSFKYERYIPPINPVWENLIKAFDATLFYPGFKRSYLSHDDYRYFSYYTTLHQKKINVGYPARFDAVLAATEIKKLSSTITTKGLEDNILYISFDSDLNRLALPVSSKEAYCFRIDGYLVIFKRTKNTEALAKYVEQVVGSDIGPEIESQLTGKSFLKNIDSIETKNVKLGFYEIDETDDLFYFKGWAYDNNSKDIQNDSLYLILETSTKRNWIYPVNRFKTNDVAAYFNNMELTHTGFGVTILKKNLATGIYRMGLYFTNKKTGYSSMYWADGSVKVKRPTTPLPIKGWQLKTGGIKFSMNKLKDTLDVVHVECWAFPETDNCENCKTYFTLTSPSITYAVEATRSLRPDVVSFFKDSSLLKAGMDVTFLKSALQTGTYKLGILYKDTVKRMNYNAETGNLIYVGLTEFAKPEILSPLPRGKESIRVFFDKVGGDENFLQIDGWAFIENLSTDFSETWLVLKSTDNSYAMPVTPVVRNDLQDYFKLSYRIEMGGLKVKVRKKDLKQGKYQTCVMMLNTKTGIKTVSCLDAFVDI